MPANIHDLVRLPDGRAGYVRIKIGELIGVSPDLSMVFVKPEDVQVVVPATRTLEDLATGVILRIRMSRTCTSRQPLTGC